MIRHGATAWTAERRYQGGRSDQPLSPQGAAALAPSGLAPRLVLVSPLLRARQTAGAVYPGAPQEVVEGLAEMDFGAFEGRTADEMAGDAAYRSWVEGGCEGRCPGGESRAAFCGRACSALADALDRALAGPAARGPLAVVAHGGTVMAALERFGEPRRPYFSWSVACGEGYLLDAGRWPDARRLVVLGPVSHARPAAGAPARPAGGR